MNKPLQRRISGSCRSLLFGAAAALMITSAQSQDAKITEAVERAKAFNDIERISKEANTTADRIGTGEIALSNTNVSTLGKGLADAIIDKPSVSPPSNTDPNRLENKADEIAEVAAFIQEGIANNPKYQKFRVAKKRTLKLLQAVLRTAAATPGLIGSSVFRDVAGSVALTIHNDFGIKDAKEAKLKKYLQGKTSAIAGSGNAKEVREGLKAGFRDNPNPNLQYEDGNIDSLSTVSDPETDQRPL